MYGNILIPVAFDHEDQIKKALTVARRLAEDRARITLLHVIEAIPGYAQQYVSAEMRDRARAEAQARLTALAVEIGAEAVVVEGHPGRTILDDAERSQVDCIVIASHRPGMADYVLGSTAARVVRHAQCSVHVVR